MPKLILDSQVVDDNWAFVAAESALDDLDLSQPVLLPLALWNQLDNSQRNTNVGLWLPSDTLPEQIEGNIPEIPVIAINFPVFGDGRGFSIGRLLRERYGFTGQLRAFGNPIRDQLSYLVRCGFNAFQLAPHYPLEDALESLQDFTEFYQTGVDQPQPLFRRR